MKDEHRQAEREIRTAIEKLGYDFTEVRVRKYHDEWELELLIDLDSKSHRIDEPLE